MDNNFKESVGELLGTMVITTAEYKELIKRSAVLELIFAQTKAAKYSGDVQAAVIAAMKITGESNVPEDEADA